MTALQQIIESVRGLNSVEQQALRDVLDQELEKASNGLAPTSNPMVGLLADEPELADMILDSAMAARESRPLRTLYE